MFGTVARLQLKPGVTIEQVKALDDFKVQIPGSLGGYVYQMDDDPSILYLAVAFDSREAYQKNAQSPEQNARYMQMMELLAADPEWHDGEIVWSASS